MENAIIEENIEDESELEKEYDSKKQSRRYMLTINNPEETDEEMEKYIKELEHFKYAMFQREKGHETETEHFQIFLVFTICKRFGTIKKLFPRAHIEPANGSNVQCRDYCSKSDTRVSGPYEIGEFAEERSRSDIKGYIELIKSGADNMTLLELYPSCYMKYHNMIENLRQEILYNELKDKEKENFTCVYIYGKSRIGKTSSLFQKYGSKAYFVSDYKNHPFDDYKNQDIMVFDEFRSQLDSSIFLKLSDRYPIQLSRRFKNIVGNYTKLFVISNIPLEKQYEWVSKTDYESYRAFLNRFNFVLRYEEKKVVLEKFDSEYHKIEELKTLLPERIYNMLDTTKIRNPISANQIQFYEVVDEDPIFD